MRIHPLVAMMLDELAERNATTASQEAHRGMRELLKAEGLWPPPPEIVEKWTKLYAQRRKKKPPP